MKKLLSIILSIGTLISLTGCNASYNSYEDIIKNGKIVEATNAEFAPFEYVENSEITGFDIDLIKAYAESINVECEIVNQDFDAALISVSKGKADLAIAAITKNTKREKTMSFSQAYYEANQVVIVKTDSVYASLTTQEELLSALSDDAVKIGVQRGTTGQYYVEGDADWEFDGIANTECVAYDNGALAVAALNNGQIQAIVIDIEPAKKYVEKNENIKIVKNVILTEEEYAIAVGKGNTSLVDSINEFINNAKTNGKYEEIVNKYFGN